MDLRERAPGAVDGPAVRHPWEAARAAFVVERLAERGVGRGHLVLDVGAGDGWLAAELQRSTGCAVTCCDDVYTVADERRLRAAGLEACRAPPLGSFDAALLLDVLEHVEDEHALLRSVVERVRQGGTVLVTVPAWPALFSAHDRALRHRRRYTPSACRRLLQGAGLVVDQAGGLFHGLLVPRTVSVLAERLGFAPRSGSAGVGHWRGGAALARATVAALRAEQRLSVSAARRRLELPGLSWFALCTRARGATWQSVTP